MPAVQLPDGIELANAQMAQNHGTPQKTIFDSIPIGLVLRLAKPYLAGESPSSAIEMAHQVYAENRFAATLDILGEDSTNDEECEAIVDAYKGLIDAVRANPIKCERPRQQMTVSMKPSMFSTITPQHGKASDKALELAFDRILRVTDYALKNQINLTLEAEDHRWTNFQLEAYIAAINAGYTNLGTVLQSRLFRTEKDLKRFDERMRVRLVIGIYNEPAQIAHTDKPTMKSLVVNFAETLLASGVYVEMATHDVKCIEQFYKT
ncbi:MAG: proline dehydrogenase family protein, partial [Terriglobales bacterium]